jgi:hypothetical protein
MGKTTLSERRDPEATGEPQVLQFFPFMPDASWFQKYWYEREPGRIGTMVGRLHPLLASAAMLRTLVKVAKVFGNRPQPNRRAGPLTLR